MSPVRAFTALSTCAMLVACSTTGPTPLPSAPPSATPTEQPPSSTPPTASATPSATDTHAVGSGAEDVRLGLEQVASGLAQPIWADSPGDGTVWIAERSGRIVLLDADGVRSEPVLDVQEQVLTGGERGLLSFALVPEGDEVTRLVVHYSARPDGRTRVSAFDVDPGSATADAATEEVLFETPQPAGNHNGGTVTVGPDGNLWLALGDGGGAGDQFGQAQRTDTELGALLRFGIGAKGAGLTVPPDNPYADGGGAPGVWAIGLRNPWRITFDGDRLYVADVGQDQREEISLLDATDHRGVNLGWPLREGSTCFSSDCGQGEELIDPIVEYAHPDGCSIIGGLVYRGAAIPALQGHYFYSDLCAGFLRSFAVDDEGNVLAEHDWTDDVDRVGPVLSFGRDAAGELLLLIADGTVQRIVAT